MEREGRRTTYASLWVLALAFGWIEASVVVYLREIYQWQVSLQAKDYWEGLQVTLVSLPSHVVALEMTREACTILLLAAVAWLAGRRPAERAGAFLLSFGIWDLTYYAGLKLVLGWPDSVSAWDILFLIPRPWVAPVWAPITVATLFIAAGSYLFGTSERERRYRWPDVGVLVASPLLTLSAFLVESKAAIDHRVPERFPVWLFWAGVVLGVAWFVRTERRFARAGNLQPKIGVHGRTVESERPPASADRRGPTTVDRAVSPHDEAAVGPVIREYTDATQRLNALVTEAGELGERFGRLAAGLSSHPGRMIVELPDRPAGDATEWDIVSGRQLPRIESLIALTSDIRNTAVKVGDLRDRLILLGRADLIEQPDGFFH